MIGTNKQLEKRNGVLKLHYKRMMELMDDGYTKEEASKMAYNEIIYKKEGKENE